MITISNKYITATVSPHGAELQSVISNEKKIEYLWNGDRKVWPRHAPVLFPVVGKLQNDTLIHGGKKYVMPRHGFARDSEFTVIHQDKETVEFELCADEKTLSTYPFHFSLRIKYSLENNALHTDYLVFNPSNENLLYALGAHPGFQLNLGGCIGMNNYYLEFEKEEDTLRYFIKDGLISGQTEAFTTTDRKIQLDKSKFQNDALVMKSFKSSSVSLLNKKNDYGVKVGWSRDFSYLGLWSVSGNEDFFCIEPWAGIADSINFNNEFQFKEGIRKLEPFASENFKLSFTFF